MFCKSLIVFGLLAAFSVQGMEATQLDARTVNLRALSDLIDQVKDLIANLNEIVSGVVGNAWSTLTGLVDTIIAIKEKFLNQGIGAIAGAVTKGIDFIASKTEEAANLGINIAQCTAGKHEQVVDLAIGLSGQLTDCVSGPVSTALKMVNEDLKIIGEITKNVTNLPADLAKCLVTLRPITCVTNMVNNLTKVIGELPGQISRIIEEVFKLVDSLAGTLGGCSNGITSTVNSKVDAIIDEVTKCVDALIPEQTFRF